MPNVILSKETEFWREGFWRHCFGNIWTFSFSAQVFLILSALSFHSPSFYKSWFLVLITPHAFFEENQEYIHIFSFWITILNNEYFKIIFWKLSAA